MSSNRIWSPSEVKKLEALINNAHNTIIQLGGAVLMGHDQLGQQGPAIFNLDNEPIPYDAARLMGERILNNL